MFKRKPQAKYYEKNFTLLVEEHKEMVFRTCMGVLHNTNDAEDVTQDVFVKVYQSLSQFRNEAEIKTWLYRIALNHSLNLLKRNKIRQTNDLFEDYSEATETELSQFQKITQTELKKALALAVRSLPENQQKVFVLNKYNELSYKQIGEVTGFSASAVESLLHRAKKNLQKRLLHFYKENYL